MKQAKLLVSPDSILQEMEQEGLITTRRVGETTIGHMLRSGGSEQSFYRITDLGRKTWQNSTHHRNEFIRAAALLLCGIAAAHIVLSPFRGVFYFPKK